MAGEKTHSSRKSDDEKSQAAEIEKKSPNAEDISERSYYYDDSCGYEIYQPDKENGDEDTI